MLGNPIMATTRGLMIVLLVLCITYVTRTAPLNISVPEVQNQFTKETSETLKEVKWGCANGTKCYKQNKLWRTMLLNLGMTTPPTRKRKNGKGKKAKKQPDDDGTRKSAIFYKVFAKMGKKY